MTVIFSNEHPVVIYHIWKYGKKQPIKSLKNLEEQYEEIKNLLKKRRREGVLLFQKISPFSRGVDRVLFKHLNYY